MWALMPLALLPVYGWGRAVEDEAFSSQFIGKTSTDGIETISGATMSSTAFIKAVDAALAAQKGA